MASLRSFGARFAVLAIIVATLSLFIAPAAVFADSPPTEYDLVYATEMAHLGDQWKERGVGPNVFDCSGLVWFAFHSNNLQDRIGGYRSVGGYYKWFKARGLVSRDNPQLGDLIVWGRNQHIGLYIGNGQAISTLVTSRGVAIHPVTGYLYIKFKAYLHTQITRPATIQ